MKDSYEARLSTEEAAAIFDVMNQLQSRLVDSPDSDETLSLKMELFQVLDDAGLLRGASSVDGLLSALAPQQRFMHDGGVQVQPLVNRGVAVFCSVSSSGSGLLIPLILLPRPRIAMLWIGNGVTLAANILTSRGYAAGGVQGGMAVGFMGIGLSYSIPGLTVYGFIGYSLFASTVAEEVEYYPPNSAPIVSGTNPPDGQAYVPVDLSALTFEISDEDRDLMSYEVRTYPDIGSGSGGLKPNGIYEIPVQGLQEYSQYRWTVNVSDGKASVTKSFTFTTEPLSPLVLDPVPSDQATEVPMDIAELRFTLSDHQGDKLDYTVETYPDIGSGSGKQVNSGSYSVPVTGCTFGTTYRWYVNVTDGSHWTRKMFVFSTGYPSQFDPLEFGWTYKRECIVVASAVNESLVNFPVFLSLQDAGLTEKAQEDGGDFLFMDADGVAATLDYELETYDHSTGMLTCFIRLPVLSPVQDTVFYLYYGNPDCLNREHPQQVWDTQFKAVWHLNSNPLQGVVDSTRYHNNGSAIGMSQTSVAAAVVGSGYVFDGVNDYVTIPDAVVLKPTEVTIWSWVKPMNIVNYRWLFGKMCTDAWGNQDALSYGIKFDPVQGRLGTFLERGDNQDTFASYPASPDAWYSSAFVYHASTTTVDYYQDGVLRESLSHGQGLRYNNPLPFVMGAGHIGTGAGINFWANCVLDEIWILDTPLTTSWMASLYANQHDPAGFVAIGPEIGP